MKKTTILTFAASTLVCLAFTACSTTPKKAAPTELTRDEIFAKADKNKDGKISREEWQEAALELTFRYTDTNNDGAISIPEWLAASRTNNIELFNSLDLNKDGKITLEECKRAVANGVPFPTMFDAVDKNNNDYVTYEEIVRFNEKRNELIP